MVDIVLPAVGDLQSTRVKALSSIDVRTNMTIELRSEVLDHIAAGMRSSLQKEAKTILRI